MHTSRHQLPYRISKRALAHPTDSTETLFSRCGVLVFGSTTAKRPTCYIELTFRTKLCGNLRAHALSRGIAHHGRPDKCWNGFSQPGSWGAGETSVR
jgi:hypothetical protein